MAYEVVKSINVNDFREIHPALDFWEDNAIVSIGGQWMDICEKRVGQEIRTKTIFRKSPTSIMNTGETFTVNSDKAELAQRKLFFTGKLDIPVGRWNDRDIEAFKRDKQANSFEDVFKLIKVNFMYYLDVADPRVYDLLSCFTMFTYLYPIFITSPILQFFGDYGTGKSRICSLLEAMAFNPVNSSNISSATIFRVIEARRATVLLDESEDLSNTPKGKEISNMLLSGTGRSGEAFRQQKDKDDAFETQTFRLFSPKVIANITGVDMAAMLSRIIRITMVALKPDKLLADRDIDQEDLNWSLIRNQLYRLALVRFKEVIYSKDNLPDHGLSARNLGIWKGIFSIANLVDKETWESIVSYAHKNKEIIESDIADNQEDSKGFLKKLLSIIDNEPLLKISSEDLMQRLLPEYYFTSAKDLSKKMNRYDMCSKDVRFGNSVVRGYLLNRDYLAELFQKIR
jgi:hypothetical protein